MLGLDRGLGLGFVFGLVMCFVLRGVSGCVLCLVFGVGLALCLGLARGIVGCLEVWFVLCRVLLFLPVSSLWLLLSRGLLLFGCLFACGFAVPLLLFVVSLAT